MLLEKDGVTAYVTKGVESRYLKDGWKEVKKSAEAKSVIKKKVSKK